jgi:hypothetical protein
MSDVRGSERAGTVERPLRLAEEVLRGHAPAAAWALGIVCGMIYGLVMGSFGGRWLQAVYSAVKVPLLLAATVALSLPSFFILNTLRGLRGDFARVLRAVLASQAAVTVVLVSLAPVTAFWYASTTDYHTAILFNALIFGVSSVAAQLPLRRAYRPLVERDPRHRAMARVWLVLYAFVGIQMGWVLRPFIGEPVNPIDFFRSGAWDNAYMVVARMAWDVIGLSR